MEKASLNTGYLLIAKTIAVDDNSLYDHLCSHWRSKKKAFVEFFLNLSSRNQIKILHYWGIVDPDDTEYLQIDEYEKPELYLFGDSPKTRELLHNLLLFFLNHGLSERPDHGLHLDNIPKKKTYGNSANWGDYVLNHSNPGRILSIIIGHVEATKPKKFLLEVAKKD